MAGTAGYRVDLPPPPFPPLALTLSKEELQETAYEILSAAWRASAASSSSSLSSSNPLSSVGLRKAPSQPILAYNASLPPAASSSLGTAAVATTTLPKSLSSIKKDLGLRPLTRENVKGGGGGGVGGSMKLKRAPTPLDVAKSQMCILDSTDARIRHAVVRATGGQVGKRVESILLPLELLQLIRPTDFSDARKYQAWQKRQLKVLETGLVLHPKVKPDQSSAQRLKQLLHNYYPDKTLETSKNSESMQALRSATASLVVGSGNTAEVSHWADGFPFNLHLYQTLLLSLFDQTEEAEMIDEVDDMVELFKKAWGVLGFHQMLHNVCLLWTLFSQFVITGETALDLLGATLAQMMEIAKAAKDIKDAMCLAVLRSTLSTMQVWAEKRLFTYHAAFPSGGGGLMEKLLPIALSAAKILHEDLPQEPHRKQKDKDIVTTCISAYVRSSLKASFAQLIEQVGMGQASTKRESGLATLAKKIIKLMTKENKFYSPFLRPWHLFAASIAAATLHSCFRKEFVQFLNGTSTLTPEVTEVLQAAVELETSLVHVVVEDAIDAEDGGKGIICEMTPFEAEKSIADLSRNWIKSKTDQICEWVDRSVWQEEWDPAANREHYARSGVEMLRIIEEAFDAFLALPVEHSILLKDLVTSIDKSLLRYTLSCRSNCGSKAEVVPPLPPLTRCNPKKAHGSLGILWKKKEESNPGQIRSKRRNDGNAVPVVDSTLSRTCVRINTLYYILKQVEDLEKRVNGIQERGKVHGGDMGVQWFERTRNSAQEGIQQLCEIAVYGVIFRDMRSVFWESLYIGGVGGVTESRIGKVLEGLEDHLGMIANVMHARLRNRVAAALMAACFETLLMVLLAGGPMRAYAATDAPALGEDLAALKELFRDDGDGLPRDAVEKAAAIPARVLALFALRSDDVIERFKSSISQTYGITVSVKSKLPLPETTAAISQWNPADPNTLLRVLCYRSDNTASKFLKKMYNLPKAI